MKNLLRIELKDTLEEVRDDASGELTTLLGVALINGVEHHVQLELVRYVEDEDEMGKYAAQLAVGQSQLYSAVLDVEEAEQGFATIQLAGYPGEWVLFLHPFDR